MQTKEDVIKILEKKINNQKTMIRDNISYLIESLNEMDSSLYTISYLSLLKDDITKKDGV